MCIRDRMLPSAIPVILMFDKISNLRKKLKYKYAQTFNFVIAYFFIWFIFSLGATVVHIILESYAILNPKSLSVSYSIGALLFFFSGIYQMTPLKDVCLRYCRNPIEILGRKNVFNTWIALTVGLKHGAYCCLLYTSPSPRDRG